MTKHRKRFLQLRDVMVPDPLSVDVATPVVDAAKIMRDNDIGDVIVTDGDAVFGILTDRDVAVRGVASGDPLDRVTAGDLCTVGVLSLDADAPIEEAAETMREEAIRRMPVVDRGHLVGIVTLGDLSIARNPDSVLSDISAAPPNS